MAEIITTTESRKFKTIVTDAGKAKITNAVLNGEKVDVVTAVVGDGGGVYFVPTPDMEELKREVWRGDIANAKINENSSNMIDITIVLPGNVGGFTVREIGIKDTAGTLIAVCNTPDVEKAVLPDGIADVLRLVMHVVFTDVEALEFKVDPSVDPMSAADLEAAMEKHNEDQNAHGGLVATLMGKAENLLPIHIGTEQPEADGPFLWLKVDKGGEEHGPDNPEEPEDPDNPEDPEALILDTAPYREGSDLYAQVEGETRSVENATKTPGAAEDEEPLKIKIN